MKTIISMLAATILSLYTFCAACRYVQALYLSAGFGDFGKVSQRTWRLGGPAWAEGCCGAVPVDFKYYDDINVIVRR
jgi:hypothetical protein